MRISGLIPATVTPFTESNAVDGGELAGHVAFVADHENVTGVAVNGHAGEVSMLDHADRAEVVRHARSALPAGKLLFAGIEAFTADHLERQAVAAADAGADGFLVIPPFDSRGLRHLARNADAVLAVFSQLD